MLALGSFPLRFRLKVEQHNNKPACTPTSEKVSACQAASGVRDGIKSVCESQRRQLGSTLEHLAGTDPSLQRNAGMKRRLAERERGREVVRTPARSCALSTRRAKQCQEEKSSSPPAEKYLLGPTVAVPDYQRWLDV